MTPPKISQNASPFYSDAEQVCRAPESNYDSEAQICRLDKYTSATVQPPAYPKVRLAARFQESSAVLRSKSSEAAFRGNVSESSDSPLLKGLAVLAALPVVVVGTGLSFLASCGGEAANPNSPPEIPQVPPEENPAPNQIDPPEGSSVDSGIGATNGSFGASECSNPADMDLASTGANLLMTCGDSSDMGAGVVEVVNPSTGAVSALNFPTDLSGDGGSRPVRLSSLAVDGDNYYAGFAPAGSDAELEGSATKLLDSGIYIASQGDVSNPTVVSFDGLSLPTGTPVANVSGVVDESGNGFEVFGFNPNTPVSMLKADGKLYVLNANRVFNYDAAAANAADPEAEPKQVLDYAPASIHAFSIGADGSLTPAQAGDQALMVGTESKPGHAYVMNGSFNPSAMADLGDGRLAVVTRGLGSGNTSVLHVYNIEDFTSGLSGANSDIAITDGSALNFSINASPHLPIVELGGTPYALLGSNDGTGRVALVNLGKDVVDSERLEFFGVFDGETNVASIVPDGDRAYVISDKGDIRPLYLFDNAEQGISFGSVGPVKKLATTDAGTHYVAGLSGNSLVAASPNNYSKASITAGPSSI